MAIPNPLSAGIHQIGRAVFPIVRHVRRIHEPRASPKQNRQTARGSSLQVVLVHHLPLPITRHRLGDPVKGYSGDKTRDHAVNVVGMNRDDVIAILVQTHLGVVYIGVFPAFGLANSLVIYP